VIRRCVRLEGLAVGECVHLGDAAVLEICTYRPGIKYLDLNGCKKITDASLRSIANVCTRLEFLNVRATNVTDSGLVSLGNGKCRGSLNELNLSYLPVSEAVLCKLVQGLSGLRVLHLYGCYNVKSLDEARKKCTKNVVINV